MHVKMIEGVRYYPFTVSFRLADGRSRRWRRWSPGVPWVYEEVARELRDRFGSNGVAEGSCFVRPVARR